MKRHSAILNFWHNQKKNRHQENNALIPAPETSEGRHAEREKLNTEFIRSIFYLCLVWKNSDSCE